MLLRSQAKAGKSKPWSFISPLELDFSYVQREFKAQVLICPKSRAHTARTV